jgi:hypothetical protein
MRRAPPYVNASVRTVDRFGEKGDRPGPSSRCIHSPPPDLTRDQPVGERSGKRRDGAGPSSRKEQRMDAEIEPIERDQFDARALMSAHPPVIRDRNKRVVFDIACPPGAVHRGRLHYTRWTAMPLPDAVDPAAAARGAVGRPGFYRYAPEGEIAGAVEWHVNFADQHLFGFYGSPLMAQDVRCRSPSTRRSGRSGRH